MKNKYAIRKGQKVIITFKDRWFNDTGKIGKFVGVYQGRPCIYIKDSSHSLSAKTPDGDKYTWSMNWNHFKVLGQLLFPFMEE